MTQHVLASLIATARQRGLDSSEVLSTFLRAPTPIVSPALQVASLTALTRYPITFVLTSAEKRLRAIDQQCRTAVPIRWYQVCS
jgi:hypothetical protein